MYDYILFWLSEFIAGLIVIVGALVVTGIFLVLYAGYKKLTGE